MADHSSPINSPGVLNQAKPRRLVTVHLHSDRYEGVCKLIAIRPKEGGPKEYVSEKIVPGAEPAVWGAAFPDERISDGDYILEVPLKTGKVKSVRQRVYVDHAYQGVMGVSGQEVKTKGSSEPILHEPLIGDGYSLEEAFLHLFNYKYADGFGSLLKLAAAKRESGGDAGEQKKAYQTVIGVTKAIHDRVSAAVGYITPDNSYYKNFFKIWETVKAKPKSWKELKDKVVSISGEKGDNAYEAAVKRWGLADWQDQVETWSKPVEVLGKILETYETAEKVGAFYSAFQEADKAEEAFWHALSSNYTTRQAAEHLEPWFSRGDLALLESLCQEADHRAGKAGVEGVGFTADAVGLMTGVFFAEGFLVSVLGKRFAKVVDVLGYIKKAAVSFDEVAFDNFITNRCANVKEWWSDLGAYTHNNTSIFHHLVGRSLRYWDQNQYSLAFLYRSKVLYGLMKLINLCGPYEKKVAKYEYQDSGIGPRPVRTLVSEGKAGETFERNVKALRIQEYIDNFILRPHFWVRNDHLTMDWVDHFHLNHEKNARDQVVRFDSPGRDGPGKAGWNQWGSQGWTKIEFQRYFPIHFLDNKDVTAFARDFSTDYTAVSESDVATTFWQAANSVKTTTAAAPGGEEEVNVEVTSWRTLRDEEMIDSETPVRAVLVLKQDSAVRTGTPVSFQVYRVDWRNIAGPAYPTLIRRLGPGDLLPSSIVDAKTGKPVSGLRNKKGAIVDFEYAYTWKEQQPSKLFRGLKPLIAPWHLALPQVMYMSAWWTIGNNEGQDWVANGQEVLLKPFCTQLEHVGLWDRRFNDRNNAKFNDRDFLRRETTSEEYGGGDVSRSDVDAVIQVGVGDLGWRGLEKGESVGFNQRVRVVLVVKRRPQYSPGIPAAVQLIRSDGTPNAPGPIYRTDKMVALDSCGFPGKWGAVLELFYYVVDASEMKAFRVSGIKPVHRGTPTDFMRMDFSKFTFDLMYRVGDSWGSKVWEVWSDWKRAEPDDIAYSLGEYAEQFSGQPYTYIFSGDGSTRKVIVLNAAGKREETVNKMVAERLLHPDVLTEAK